MSLLRRPSASRVPADSQSISSESENASSSRRKGEGHFPLYDLLEEAELGTYFPVLRGQLKLQHAEHLRYVKEEDLNEIGMSKPEQRRLWKVFNRRCPGGFVGKLKRKVLERIQSGDGSQSGRLSRKNSDRKPPSGKTNGTFGGEGSSGHEQHIIPADGITLCKMLGEGEFGTVWQGVWTPLSVSEKIQVAVKCVAPEKMQTNPLDFIQEAAILHRINHPHIVRLYGVVLDTKSIMLVNELAPLRSLLECLREKNLRSSFPVLRLCDYSEQICEGMAYLESSRLIHRDLAARNILVFSAEKVKISDFGLSRALGVGEEYYRSNFSVNLRLPIAWCAPESINFLKFTSASDVWSFGVTLWEMLSYGFQPWVGMTGGQILQAIDTPKCQRLQCPDACPSEYFSLMNQCWEHDLNTRPKFSDIASVLPEIRPERVQTLSACEDGVLDHLQYSAGQIITVLNKRPKEYPDGYYWKGVVDSGVTGLFLPTETVAYLGMDTPQLPHWQSLGGRTTHEPLGPLLKSGSNTSLTGSLNSLRSSFGKGGGTQGTKVRKNMISAPQSDLRHTGHLGIDGTSFGDLATISGKPPKQIVTPMKQDNDDTDSIGSLNRNFDEEIDQTLTDPTPTGSQDNFSFFSSSTRPVVNVTTLNRGELDSSQYIPDLETPHFDNTTSGGSLLDEVFGALDRGSQSGSMWRGGGVSIMEDKNWDSSEEPASPLSLFPDDTTDRTRLIQNGSSGNSFFNKATSSNGSTGKPEAMVRPISFADKQMLQDMSVMAKKISDKTWSVESERLSQEIANREAKEAAELHEALERSKRESSNGSGSESSMPIPATRKPSKGIKSTLVKHLKKAGSPGSSASDGSSSEATGVESNPSGSQSTRKCFSDHLPPPVSIGSPAKQRDSGWSPAAEDAYKSLIENGRSIRSTNFEISSPRPLAPASASSSPFVGRSRSPSANPSEATVRAEEETEVDSSPNPLRMLRRDAGGIARSFKAPVRGPVIARARPELVSNTGSAAPDGYHLLEQATSGTPEPKKRPAPPPVPPKPKGKGCPSPSPARSGANRIPPAVAPKPVLPPPAKSPVPSPDQGIDFTFESVDKYQLLDFVLGALDNSSSTKTESADGSQITSGNETNTEATSPTQRLQYVELAFPNGADNSPPLPSCRSVDYRSIKGLQNGPSSTPSPRRSSGDSRGGRTPDFAGSSTLKYLEDRNDSDSVNL